MHLNFDVGSGASIASKQFCLDGRSMLKGLACFVLLLSTASVALAQASFEEDFDDGEKPWQEIVIGLPATPLAENLVPFFVSATATQDFSIDAKSLTLGTDGVIRYTLLTTSASGARNVSYEGIRCQAYEKKLYAFGHPDGTWSRSRRDKWEPIRSNSANRQHAALAQDYFCQGLTVAGSAQQILDRLKKRQPLAQ